MESIYIGNGGGYLNIVKQDKIEFKQNLTTYKFLADRGGQYSLLSESPIQGVKNPDAFNHRKLFFSDAKHPQTLNGRNAVQNSIRTANMQRAEEVVIDLKNHYSTQSLYEGLVLSLQAGRSLYIKQIIIIRQNSEPLYFDANILRQRFEMQKIKGSGTTSLG